MSREIKRVDYEENEEKKKTHISGESYYRKPVVLDLFYYLSRPSALWFAYTYICIYTILHHIFSTTPRVNDQDRFKESYEYRLIYIV